MRGSGLYRPWFLSVQLRSVARRTFARIKHPVATGAEARGGEGGKVSVGAEALDYGFDPLDFGGGKGFGIIWGIVLSIISQCRRNLAIVGVLGRYLRRWRRITVVRGYAVQVLGGEATDNDCAAGLRGHGPWDRFRKRQEPSGCIDTNTDRE